jgi:hypothetical protein
MCRVGSGAAAFLYLKSPLPEGEGQGEGAEPNSEGTANSSLDVCELSSTLKLSIGKISRSRARTGQ